MKIDMRPSAKRARMRYTRAKGRRTGPPFRRRRETWLEENAEAIQMGTVAAVAMIVGVSMAMLFDPVSGRRRRARLRDKLAKARHVVTRRIGRSGRYVAGLIRGKTRAAFNAIQPHDYENADHVVLDRIESIVFRDPDVPKGQINLSVVNGRAELRGAVNDPHWIGELEKRVRAVPGVEGVDNLLHMKGTDPPNTVDALEASEQAEQVWKEQALPHT